MQTITVDTRQLLRDFTDAAGSFTALLELVPEAAFNAAPFEGSWSPAQVGDHVLKFLSGIAAVQELPKVKPERSPDVNEPILREIFLNFSKKAKAPAFVAPATGPLDKEPLIAALKNVTEKVAGGGGKELLMICQGADFPTIGEMTGLEWIYFGVYHLQRHRHQLSNMKEYFN